MSVALVVLSLHMSQSLPVSLPIDDAKAISKTRSQEIERLLTVARTGVQNEDSKAAEAMRCLGVMRAVEAVPFLVQHITYSPPIKGPNGEKFVLQIGGFPEPSINVPAVYALGRIGGPAHDQLLNRLAKEGDAKPDLVPYIAIPLSMSLGADDAIAVVKARAAAAKDPAVARHFQRLASWIDKHERNMNYE